MIRVDGFMFVLVCNILSRYSEINLCESTTAVGIERVKRLGDSIRISHKKTSSVVCSATKRPQRARDLVTS